MPNQAAPRVARNSASHLELRFRWHLWTADEALDPNDVRWLIKLLRKGIHNCTLEEVDVAINMLRDTPYRSKDCRPNYYGDGNRGREYDWAHTHFWEVYREADEWEAEHGGAKLTVVAPPGAEKSLLYLPAEVLYIALAMDEYEGSVYAADVAERHGVAQNLVSRHLQTLKAIGIVEQDPHSNRRWRVTELRSRYTLLENS